MTLIVVILYFKKTRLRRQTRIKQLLKTTKLKVKIELKSNTKIEICKDRFKVKIFLRQVIHVIKTVVTMKVTGLEHK